MDPQTKGVPKCARGCGNMANVRGLCALCADDRIRELEATIERVRVRLDDIEEEWGPGMGRPPVIAVIRAELDIPTTEGG